MQPQKDYRNGESNASCAACGGDEAAEAEGGPDAQLTFEDPDLVPAALRALNTMRKNRQFFDVVLHAGSAEVPAHRAVLAAVSPYLFELFTADQDRSGGAGGGSLPLSYKLNGVSERGALPALVEYAYTGRLSARAAQVRAVYLCAWQLRMDGVVARCADHLAAALCPESCLAVRALPGLGERHLAAIDAYIADNFLRLCGGAALGALPSLRLEVLEATAGGAGLADAGVAAAAALALHWLRGELTAGAALDELAERAHLLYVARDRRLRDCAALPPASTDAPELQDYRRRAAHHAKGKKNGAPPTPPVVAAAGPGRPRLLLYAHDIAERHRPEPDWAVIASAKVGENAYLALCTLGGRLAQVSVCTRACESPLPSPAPLPAPPAAARALAPMEQPRCAHGTASLAAGLLVCGGYDRVECLRSCERYDARANVWRPLPDMRQARARFNVAKVGRCIYAVGGSDGHVELDSVEMLELDEEEEECEDRRSSASPSSGSEAGGERPERGWARRARLPLARSHAAVASHAGLVYCVGGLAGQVGVRDCHAYEAACDRWTTAAPLRQGRQQAAACVWAGCLWALGGCDAWRCLASTERLALEGEAAGEWESGPPLGGARRGAAAAAWRGRLVALGGSDGAASLRCVELLAAAEGAWAAGPALREARAGLGAAVVDDRLYAVGGFSGKLFLSSVEYLQEPDGEWTSVCCPRDLSAGALAPLVPLAPLAPPAPPALPAAPAPPAALAPPAPSDPPTESSQGGDDGDTKATGGGVRSEHCTPA